MSILLSFDLIEPLQSWALNLLSHSILFSSFFFSHSFGCCECWLPVSNVDFLCVQQSDTALFCENYIWLYFDSKHLEKGLKRGEEIFGAIFFSKKVPILANIGYCPNFLDEALATMNNLKQTSCHRPHASQITSWKTLFMQFFLCSMN